MNTKLKQQKRARRHSRVRVRIFGASKRPRLSVFRSNKHIYLQAIDDEKGETIASASDLKIDFKKSDEKQQTKIKIAEAVGERLAKDLTAKKIKKAIFDRGEYKYHGRIKAAAEGARKAGLEF